jgi:hypothetical protein
VSAPGDSHTNTATAAGVDDDGAAVMDDDSAIVAVKDVPSSIRANKEAVPDQLDEPGSPPDFTFTFTVTNHSAVDTVTIDTLSDTVYLNLNGQGTCSVPQELSPGESYTCAITVPVNGNAGFSETNTFTASGLDDDGNPVSATASDTVSIVDVLPGDHCDQGGEPPSVLGNRRQRHVYCDHPERKHRRIVHDHLP